MWSWTQPREPPEPRMGLWLAQVVQRLTVRRLPRIPGVKTESFLGPRTEGQSAAQEGGLSPRELGGTVSTSNEAPGTAILASPHNRLAWLLARQAPSGRRRSP